ncbi:MAG: reverse transcriptase family protein [Spirochaetes bacterium]|nr:reverse transcriptase family protein [Spirochaetota bacterium]
MHYLLNFQKNKNKYIELLKKETLYVSFPLKKRNGSVRWIDAPIEELKTVQKEILTNLLDKIPVCDWVYGFVKNKSAIDGAKLHLNKKVILNIDIKDFFSSITLNKVYGIFIKIVSYNNNKYNLNLTNQIELVNYLSLLTTRNGKLPQGAPTSPALSNIYMYYIDNRFNSIAKQYNLTYTRYADDLTFSSDDYNFDMKIIINKVEPILNAAGLKINKKKLRIMRPHRRMEVTGIVVNKQLGVPRYKWKNLRAMLHNIDKNNIKLKPKEIKQILGKIEWISKLNPKRGNQLNMKLQQILLKEQ